MQNDIVTQQGSSMPPNERVQQRTEARSAALTISTAIFTAAEKAALGAIEDLVGNGTSALIKASYIMIVDSLITKASDQKTITASNHEESLDV